MDATIKNINIEISPEATKTINSMFEDFIINSFKEMVKNKNFQNKIQEQIEESIDVNLQVIFGEDSEIEKHARKIVANQIKQSLSNINICREK